MGNPTSRSRYSAARPACVLLLTSIIAHLLAVWFQDILSHMACSREALLHFRVHTLVTYAIVPASLINLARVSFSLLFSVYFIGDLLSRTQIWMLFGGSTVLGGLLFCLLVFTPSLLVGGVMITWALAGAVLALGFRNWKEINWLRRICFIYIVISTLAVIFVFDALILVQLLVGAAGFIATWIWSRNSPLAIQHQTQAVQPGDDPMGM